MYAVLHGTAACVGEVWHRLHRMWGLLHMVENSFISTNLIHNSYINYIKLNASTCFERHPPILRRSISLIVHVCSLWYSHSVKVNYCFIVLGICYHFVKKETAMCGCVALCCTITVS